MSEFLSENCAFTIALSKSLSASSIDAHISRYFRQLQPTKCLLLSAVSATGKTASITLFILATEAAQAAHKQHSADSPQPPLSWAINHLQAAPHGHATLAAITLGKIA